MTTAPPGAASVRVSEPLPARFADDVGPHQRGPADSPTRVDARVASYGVRAAPAACCHASKPGR
ncbi:hypothetical protein WT27_09470 [Burkholderia territorii]|uniref:Uncharacterized protein n=1 Tax=Burkholderia territorii TaxID=1503055 RepID=A0A105V9Z7_9BURK|nr:hypothetical protein WT27_09470 [Burkholderia territorii]